MPAPMPTPYRHSIIMRAGGEEACLKIAKPVLLVSTPIGVAWGFVEAWKVRWWLGLLMMTLVGVIGAFAWLTVRTILRERRDPG
jgi:hypothetical protein